MRGLIVIVATLFLACMAQAGPSTRPSTQQSRLETARALWQKQLAETGGKAVVTEHYPTEKALPFLDAFSFTQDPKFATQAALQLEYAHAREKDDLLLTFKNI